jgi:hypothetical protein
VKKQMAGRRGKFVDGLLQRVQENSAPSMMAVVFENQMAMARGVRCVLKVPVALTGCAPPTNWAALCPAMATVDAESLARHTEAAASGYVFYDGFDIYATEREARDTRFVEPLVTRPNPVYEGDCFDQAFEDREVFHAPTIVSVASTGSSKRTAGTAVIAAVESSGSRLLLLHGGSAAPGSASPAADMPAAPASPASPASHSTENQEWCC